MRAFSRGLGLALLLGIESTAHASGLYFTDRGVRPMGRGGAFVAGADDLGAIWYNPAGLADAGTSVLLDFTWLHFTSEFTRRTQVTDAGGTVRVYESPSVAGTSPVLPIPTIAGSLAFGEKKNLVAAFGVFAPYTAITSYPLAVNGQPSPSRYSLVSLDGSALINVGGYLAWKPIEDTVRAKEPDLYLEIEDALDLLKAAGGDQAKSAKGAADLTTATGAYLAHHPG